MDATQEKPHILKEIWAKYKQGIVAGLSATALSVSATTWKLTQDAVTWPSRMDKRLTHVEAEQAANSTILRRIDNRQSFTDAYIRSARDSAYLKEARLINMIERVEEKTVDNKQAITDVNIRVDALYNRRHSYNPKTDAPSMALLVR